MAGHECAQLQGTLLGISAINEAGGILGREVRPVVCDPASDATLAARLVEKMIVSERVSHIFGCLNSVHRKRIVPIVERHNAMLWYPALFEGFEHSPNIIYGGACPNQHVAPLVDFMLSLGFGRFVLVGSDYVFPRETNRVFRQLVQSAGGEIAGEYYVPQHASLREIECSLADFDHKPDAIFSTVLGPSSLRFYRFLKDRGVTAPVANIGACELDLAIAPDLFDRHICATPYFESIGDRSNCDFLKAFHRRFGTAARANWLLVNSFTQVQMFARAVQNAGSTNVDAVALEVGTDSFDGPFGPCRIDQETNYTYCHPRIGIANGRGNFDIAFEAENLVQPDPFFISYA